MSILDFGKFFCCNSELLLFAFTSGVSCTIQELFSLHLGARSILSITQAGLHSTRPQNACTQCVAMIRMINALCAFRHGRLRKTLMVYDFIAVSRMFIQCGSVEQNAVR